MIAVFIPLHCKGVPNGRGSPVQRGNYPVASRYLHLLDSYAILLAI